jgi:ABC-2 type transport system permease protein
MNPLRTLATTRRVLGQLKHDHRTIGLILFVPSVLLVVLYYVFADAEQAFQNAAPIMLGIFPFTVMFIVTSVAMLRERTSGTLERLMTMPMAKLDLLLGYGLAFGLLAMLQATVASTVATQLLGVTIDGGLWALLGVAGLGGVVGMALGLFASAFAHSEFQAVQFMPAFIAPQILMCGLFVPRDSMHDVLYWISDLMPLTYAVEAIKVVATSSTWTTELTNDLWILAGFALGALILAAATLRRRS